MPHESSRRDLYCHFVIFGSPVLAAAVSVSLFHVARSSPAFGVQTAFSVLFWINATLAAGGSAAATVFLSGRQGVRIAGAFAYAVFAFLVYLILTITGLQVFGP